MHHVICSVQKSAFLTISVLPIEFSHEDPKYNIIFVAIPWTLNYIQMSCTVH